MSDPLMTADMAAGALAAIRNLLDDGGIPRGTFGDDQVRNLVALYNQRGDELTRLRARIAAALDALRTAPDLDTAEPSKAVLRRAHRAVSVAWAELADEAVSERQEVTVHRVGSGRHG